MNYFKIQRKTRRKKKKISKKKKIQMKIKNFKPIKKDLKKQLNLWVK